MNAYSIIRGFIISIIVALIGIATSTSIVTVMVLSFVTSIIVEIAITLNHNRIINKRIKTMTDCNDFLNKYYGINN